MVPTFIADRARFVRHPLAWLALLLLFALSLELLRMWHVPPALHDGETAHWWPLAQNVAHGLGYVSCDPGYFPFCSPSNQQTASREPFPIFLFALVAWLSGDSLQIAALVMLAVHLGIIAGIYALTRALRPQTPLAALLAAALWATYLPARWLVPQVSGDLPAALWTTWGVFFFVRGGETQRVRDWLISGALFGLAALSRSAMLSVALGLALVAGVWTLRERRMRRAALVFSAAVVLFVTPWLVRDYLTFGRVVLGSTFTDYNFYRFNAPLAGDNFLRFVAGDEADLAVKQLVARRTDLRGSENEAEMGAVYREEALKLIAAHPLQFAQLALFRLLPLWFDYGVNDAYGLTTTRDNIVVAIEQAALILFALAGARLLGRPAIPVGLVIALFTLAHMLVAARLRFVVNIMPLVISLASLGLIRMLQIWTEVL